MSDRTRRSRPAPIRARRVLATGAAALIPLACGHSTPETTSPDLKPSPSRGGSLADTEWILIELRGEPPLGGAEITLAFDDSSAGGYAGCNHYGGVPMITTRTIQLKELVATARACEDARLMDQEADYLAFLGETSLWEIEGDTLTLRSGTAGQIEGNTVTIQSASAGTLVFRAARER